MTQDATLAATATAQSGESMLTTEDFIMKVKTHTIERCAQVAEAGNDGIGSIRLEIAAAIRKLKDDK